MYSGILLKIDYLRLLGLWLVGLLVVVGLKGRRLFLGVGEWWFW